MTKHSILLPCLLLALLPIRERALAQRQNIPAPTMSRPILNSQVDFTYIGFYLPKRMLDADDLLGKGKLKQAAPLLKAEALKHDEDLGAYAEWMQADHTVWDAEAIKMQNRLQANPNDRNAMFKLSVILLYQWYIDEKEDANLERARTLMRRVWDESHLTLAGLFLAEMGSRPLYRSERRWSINDEIMAQLLSPPDLAAYREAKRNGWRAPPPAMQNMPDVRMRQLHGVVLNLRSLNDIRFARAVYLNGKLVGEKWDITPQQEAALHRYADEWYLSIRSRIKKKIAAGQ